MATEEFVGRFVLGIFDSTLSSLFFKVRQHGKEQSYINFSVGVVKVGLQSSSSWNNCFFVLLLLLDFFSV